MRIHSIRKIIGWLIFTGLSFSLPTAGVALPQPTAAQAQTPGFEKEEETPFDFQLAEMEYQLNKLKTSVVGIQYPRRLSFISKKIDSARADIRDFEAEESEAKESLRTTIESELGEIKGDLDRVIYSR